MTTAVVSRLKNEDTSATFCSKILMFLQKKGIVFRDIWYLKGVFIILILIKKLCLELNLILLLMETMCA